jgi:secreted trypsin-like serine protease
LSKQIDEWWVLTAAHCCLAVGPFTNNYKIRIGTHSLQTTTEANAKTLRLDRIEVHPEYNDQTKQQDFCLLKTAEVQGTLLKVANLRMLVDSDTKVLEDRERT